MYKNKKTRALAACLLVLLILPSLGGCVIQIPPDITSVIPVRDDGLYINGERFDLTVPDSGSYFYDQLTDSQKTMYTSSLTALGAGYNVYELVGVDCDEYAEGCKRSTEALLRDHPEFFWIDGGNQVKSTIFAGKSVGTVEITLSKHTYWDREDISAAKKEFESAVSELIEKANSYDTPYEKVKFLNDWLAENIEYDFDSYNNPSDMDEEDYAFVNSIYGALVKKKTLCGGYAHTFSYIMNRLGVETLYVTGTTPDGLHAWNMVNLRGKNYHIDTTWADDNEKGRTVYSYFCLDDKEMSLTHTVDGMFAYPAATGTEYNYYRYEGLYLDSYSFNKYNALFTERYSGGEFSVKFPNQVVLHAAVRDIIDNSRFYKLHQMDKAKNYSYSIDDVHCILTVYP